MTIPHTKNHYKGKCPRCRSIVEFHSVHFTIENDNGEIISICDSCDEKFKIITENPDESYIAYGARKESCIDYEIEPPSEYPAIQDVIYFQGSLNNNKSIFDPNVKPIYLCKSCGNSLENLAFTKLNDAFTEIIKAYNDYTIIDIKGYGYNPNKAIFVLKIQCLCNEQYSAVFYKKYDHSEYNISDFNLGNIIKSKPLGDIVDGTMSKDDFMEVLKKILVRWELFFDKALIITPFVGHQYLPDEKLIDTWFSIISQISNEKAKLITRTASLNKIKRAISNIIYDYDRLKEYQLSVPHIDEAIKLQSSHAKIYCGLSCDYCELIHGSANLVYGPSKEQVSFKVYNKYHELYDKFLRQLEIKGLDLGGYLTA